MRFLTLLKLFPVKTFHNFDRKFASASADKALLLKLRKTTGLSFSICKDALLKHNNDFSKAIVWLKEEAVRRGWDKANRLSSRVLSQGLLGVLSGPRHAVIVEVNCETDFVARNETFQNLVAGVTEAAMDNFMKSGSPSTWSAADLSTLKIPICGSLVCDKAASVIGVIGENVAVRRGAGICVQDPKTFSRLAVYSHLSGGDIRQSVRDVQFGKYAAIIRYRPLGDQNPTTAWHERASHLGRQLCQHIVGMNPRPGLELTEPSADPEEERCLLHQPFFLDETISVGEHLARNEMVLEDFIRVECGQDDEANAMRQATLESHAREDTHAST